jgi:hypothetical protein
MGLGRRSNQVLLSCFCMLDQASKQFWRGEHFCVKSEGLVKWNSWTELGLCGNWRHSGVEGEKYWLMLEMTSAGLCHWLWSCKEISWLFNTSAYSLQVNWSSCFSSQRHPSTGVLLWSPSINRYSQIRLRSTMMTPWLQTTFASLHQRSWIGYWSWPKAGQECLL